MTPTQDATTPPSPQTWFDRAQEVIPGGVNSPVRAFGSVGGTPLCMARGQGAYLWDTQGKQYIDYVGSWGPMILGHAHAEVVAAIQQAATRSASFGTATLAEVDLAQHIKKTMPAIQMVRLVNSGTEATMSALRLARAFTSRDKIIKFAGCYHGHADSFLVQAGSGAATFGVPTSPGVPQSVAADTLTAPYNDLPAVERLLREHPDQIAAIIVEPIVGNAGVILPESDFLPGLRRLCDDHNTLLILDEVMTGFRVAPGGAQQLYHIQPDLVTLGKIIGGGLPIGAFGGRRDIMKLLAPAGPVYQAGTLSGNPVAVAAGLTTLRLLDDNLYQQLETRAAQLEDAFRANLQKLDLSYHVTRAGSMACLFFTDQPVRNFDAAKTCDTQKFARYFHAMLDQGVYLPPSQFEAFFISAAHSEQDIERTAAANYQALKQIA